MTLKINSAGSPPVKTRNNVSSQQEKQEYKSLQRVLTLCANKVRTQKIDVVCRVQAAGAKRRAGLRSHMRHVPYAVSLLRGYSSLS